MSFECYECNNTITSKVTLFNFCELVSSKVVDSKEWEANTMKYTETTTQNRYANPKTYYYGLCDECLQKAKTNHIKSIENLAKRNPSSFIIKHEKLYVIIMGIITLIAFCAFIFSFITKNGFQVPFAFLLIICSIILIGSVAATENAKKKISASLLKLKEYNLSSFELELLILSLENIYYKPNIKKKLIKTHSLITRVHSFDEKSVVNSFLKPENLKYSQELIIFISKDPCLIFGSPYHFSNQFRNKYNGAFISLNEPFEEKIGILYSPGSKYNDIFSKLTNLNFDLYITPSYTDTAEAGEFRRSVSHLKYFKKEEYKEYFEKRSLDSINDPWFAVGKTAYSSDKNIYLGEIIHINKSKSICTIQSNLGKEFTKSFKEVSI